MKLRLEDKQKAIELRIQGKSYGQIRSIIPNLSKSTLSGWIKNIKLTPQQEGRLKKNIKKITYNARVKSAWTKKENKKKKIERIFQLCNKEFSGLSKNVLFLLGIVLYWAEGNKKTPMFQFTNSDPHAVRLMLNWLTGIAKIPKEKIKIRLYIHKVYSHENCERYWSGVTKIPVNKFQKTIYKPTIHKRKKNPEYKGCIQLRVLESKFYWKTMGWIKALVRYYNF